MGYGIHDISLFFGFLTEKFSKRCPLNWLFFTTSDRLIRTKQTYGLHWSFRDKSQQQQIKTWIFERAKFVLGLHVLTKTQTHSTQRERDRLLGGHRRALRPCQFKHDISKQGP